MSLKLWAFWNQCGRICTALSGWRETEHPSTSLFLLRTVISHKAVPLLQIKPTAGNSSVTLNFVWTPYQKLSINFWVCSLIWIFHAHSLSYCGILCLLTFEQLYRGRKAGISPLKSAKLTTAEQKEWKSGMPVSINKG